MWFIVKPSTVGLQCADLGQVKIRVCSEESFTFQLPAVSGIRPEEIKFAERFESG